MKNAIAPPLKKLGAMEDSSQGTAWARQKVYFNAFNLRTSWPREVKVVRRCLNAMVVRRGAKSLKAPKRDWIRPFCVKFIVLNRLKLCAGLG